MTAGQIKFFNLTKQKENKMTNQNGNSEALLITIVQPNPAEMRAMGQYAQASGKVANEYGAEVLVKFNVTEQLHGELPAAIVGIAKFESADKIKEMFSSDAYQKLVPMQLNMIIHTYMNVIYRYLLIT